MKNHIVFKFLAIFLCTAMLLICVASGLGVAALYSMGLYRQDVEDYLEDLTYSNAYGLAQAVASRYAADQTGQWPDDFLEHFYYESSYGEAYSWDNSRWFYTITDESSETVLESNYSGQLVDETLTYLIQARVPRLISYREHGTDYEYSSYNSIPGPTGVTEPGTVPPTVPETTAATVPDATVQTTTEPTAATEAPESEYMYEDSLDWYDSEKEISVAIRYEVRRLDTPYMVTLYLMKDARTAYEPAYEALTLLHTYRNELIGICLGSLFLFAVLAVYLCCAAGRKPGSDEIKPGGLNILPLDLYILCAGVGVFLCAALGVQIIDYMSYAQALELVPILALALLGYAAALLVVAVLYAIVTQVKAGNLFWLRRSLVGMTVIFLGRCIAACVRWISRAGEGLDAKLAEGSGSFFKKCADGLRKLWAGCKKLALIAWTLLCTAAVSLWQFTSKAVSAAWRLVCRAASWLWRTLSRFLSLLPLTWQWLLVGVVMIFVIVICVNSYRGPLQMFGWVFTIGIILYGAHAFGILLESAKRMSEGDLDTKVSDQFLLGSFKDFAAHLNALAGVAVIAAQKQMKSERMKAELVTNVSHDIKTPLTSIINYVDLLQKAQSEAEAEQYLEVLSRQSQRLKKLIEDLMEMSKASTGNIAVEISTVDAAEAVNQALGEFADKLSEARLIPVFNPPETPIAMRADGRLAWRVLSNLLSNAVKYALPGTRLYIDLVQLDGKVLISLKNISREQLNVSSDELMERFVRGDASRNTDGSGLGLNIAKSLMEIQQGQLQLLVDGDLFKATAIFPAAKHADL